jgi:hypothetical protein
MAKACFKEVYFSESLLLFKKKERKKKENEHSKK